jgi:hypothetical protein
MVLLDWPQSEHAPCAGPFAFLLKDPRRHGFRLRPDLASGPAGAGYELVINLKTAFGGCHVRRCETRPPPCWTDVRTIGKT